MAETLTTFDPAEGLASGEAVAGFMEEAFIALTAAPASDPTTVERGTGPA